MSSAAYSSSTRGFLQHPQRDTLTSGSSNEPLTGNSTGPSSTWYQETLPPSPSSPLPPLPPSPPAQPQRHPYQLAGLDFRGDVDDYSDVGYHQGRPGYTPVPRNSNLDSEKLPPILPSTSAATSRAYTLPSTSQQRPPTSGIKGLGGDGEETGPLTRVLQNPLVILLLFLPLPPLLSILYTTTGHAILQTATNASASPRSTYAAPILSSVNAAATGGIILSLPIALLLYLLLVPDSVDPLRPITSFTPSFSQTSAPSSSSNANTNPHARPRIPTHRRRPTPEDFFDDSDSSTGFFSLTSLSANLRLYTGYLTCAILLLFIGAFAAPLGVTCLMKPSDRFLPRRRLLSTRAAAVAGVVGGVVLVGAVIGVALVGLVGWGVWMRRTSRRRKVAEHGSLQA